MKPGGSLWVGEEERVETEGEVEAEIEVRDSWCLLGMKEMNLREFEERERGGWFKAWERDKGWHLGKEEKAIETI